MRSGFAAPILVSAAATASLSFGPPASAATEVGNDCPATKGIAGVAFVQLTAAPSNPLPLTAPTDGVVTKWKVTRAFSVLEPFEVKLKVFRATAIPNQFEVAGESGIEVVEEGPNAFDARIPVKAGDRFGLFGETPSGALNCVSKTAQDVVGQGLGNVPPGSTQAFGKEELNSRVAVSAVVEPDVDRDGYGDETQDSCPRRAAIQTGPCPPVRMASFALAKRESALVLVTSDLEVPVTVSGTVSVPKAAGASARRPARIRLSAMAQTVAPGQIAQFVLSFPKALKSALRKLPRNRSLRLGLDAAGTGPTGAVTTSSSSVRLRGQAPLHR
jgi:hypothetical protein